MSSFRNFPILSALLAIFLFKADFVFSQNASVIGKFQFAGPVSVQAQEAAEEETLKKPDSAVTIIEEEKVPVGETASVKPPSFPWWGWLPIFLGFLLVLLLVVLLRRGKRGNATARP